MSASKFQLRTSNIIMFLMINHMLCDKLIFSELSPLELKIFLFNWYLFMTPSKEEGVYCFANVGRWVDQMVSADYLKYHLSQSSYFTCRLVMTSRWPLLILGSLGQRSRSGEHMCRSTFLVTSLFYKVSTKYFRYYVPHDKPHQDYVTNFITLEAIFSGSSWNI